MRFRKAMRRPNCERGCTSRIRFAAKSGFITWRINNRLPDENWLRLLPSFPDSRSAFCFGNSDRIDDSNYQLRNVAPSIGKRFLSLGMVHSAAVRYSGTPDWTVILD